MNKTLLLENKDVQNKLKIFVIFHKKLDPILRKHKKPITIFFAVNKNIPKDVPKEFFEDSQDNQYTFIAEYDLKKYDPMFQDFGYNESSAIVHIGNNNLHKNDDKIPYEYIGFSQYDQFFEPSFKEINELRPNICYYGYADLNYMLRGFPVLFFLENYNNYYGTNYKPDDIIKKAQEKFNGKIAIPLLSTFIIHNTIYEKLFPFWTQFMYSVSCIVKDPRLCEKHKLPTHHRHVSGIMERVFGLCLIFEDLIMKKIHTEFYDHLAFDNYPGMKDNLKNVIPNKDTYEDRSTPKEIIEKYIENGKVKNPVL